MTISPAAKGFPGQEPNRGVASKTEDREQFKNSFKREIKQSKRCGFPN
jgi:hypothetical protein